MKEEVEKPLLYMYTRLNGETAKLKLMSGLLQAMENEDVLYALKDSQFKGIIGVVLTIYAREKATQMEEEVNKSRHIFDTSVSSQQAENKVGLKSQELLSVVLNSKEFTNSLVTLLQLIS